MHFDNKNMYFSHFLLLFLINNLLILLKGALFNVEEGIFYGKDKI